MRFVVLPQTFRLSLPPVGNDLAFVIKDTSLLAAVAGGEIASGSQNFAGTLSIFGYPVEWLFAIWTAVAIAYFVATFSVTRILLVLERRFHTPGLEAVSICFGSKGFTRTLGLSMSCAASPSMSPKEKPSSS